MRISVLGAAITSVVLFVAAARAGEGSGVALPAGEKTITLIANDGSRKTSAALRSRLKATRRRSM